MDLPAAENWVYVAVVNCRVRSVSQNGDAKTVMAMPATYTVMW